MSYVKIRVHAIWSRKHEEQALPARVAKSAIGHIWSNARIKRMQIDRLNGSGDLVHCLFTLAATQSVADTIKLIKGESSWWINRQGMLDGRFEWGEGYYARSISEWDLGRVRAYIDRQDWDFPERNEDQRWLRFIREALSERGRRNYWV